MTINQARHEAEEFAKTASKYEAEFKDLERREPGILAGCIYGVKQLHPEFTYQWAKNTALTDLDYTGHLDDMKEAQEKHLAADKAFRTIIEYLKAVQSENYKRNQELKAGIL